MNQGTTLLALGGISVVMVGVALLLMRQIDRDSQYARRIIAVRGAYGADAAAGTGGSWVLRMVASVGRVLARSGLLPGSTIAELEQTLQVAGFRQGNGLGLFIGGKLLLLLLLPGLAALALHGTTLQPMLRVIAIGGAAIVGLLLPDLILSRIRKRYLAALERGLPDALDMLVICSEAGLGLEFGLERVATEIEPAHPAVAAEFRLTSGELRILSDRRAALGNMGARTGLESLRRLASTLIQTLQYGTPLSQALRTLSAEMRYEMLMRFEERAARLPVLLTVPMILFILPCIFIVVGGPAGLTVMRTFMHQ